MNDFPSGTSRPSQTMDQVATSRNVFGEETPPQPLNNTFDPAVFGVQFLRERRGQPTQENNESEMEIDDHELSLGCNEDGMESVTVPPSDHECGQMSMPKKGMEFPSEERAHKFYTVYAERLGFKVRKGKVQRTADQAIRTRFLLCSKEGRKRSKKISEGKPKYNRRETRTDCKAQIRLRLENGKWVIYYCSLEHNHELERPGQRHEMDTYSANSQVVVRESTVDGSRIVDEESGTAEDRSPEEFGISNYPANSQVVMRESTVDGSRVVDKEGGTAENGSPEEFGISNYLPDKNVVKLPPEDVQSLLDCFAHLQAEDRGFFYSIQVNSESKMTSFFWRDGRSRIDYDYFGDMLVLDTYRYEMDNKVICTPFFGINHHKDPILFGCAFLLDKTVASFRWLFKTFLEAMGDRQPKILFTDACENIAGAVKKECPQANHRIILSSIYEQIRKGQSFASFIFELKLRDCQYYCQSEQEFEHRWNLLVENISLQEYPWLATLYKSREKWSHLFSKVLAFPADIESLIDLELIVDIFPSWTGGKATLSDIFEKYIERAEQLRSDELKSDFRSLRKPLDLGVGMSEHAAAVYTLNVLEVFECEFKKVMSLAMEEVSPGPTCVFKLKHFEYSGDEEEVRFDCSRSAVSCSCKHFERTGILCRHSLKVLNAKNIFRIPEQYILKRWTRFAKEGEVVKGNSERDDQAKKNRRLHSRNLTYQVLNVITKSVATEETRKNVERHLESALREADDSLGIEPEDANSRGDVEEDEVCCGERHCPFEKRKKTALPSTSDNEPW